MGASPARRGGTLRARVLMQFLALSPGECKQSRTSRIKSGPYFLQPSSHRSATYGLGNAGLEFEVAAYMSYSTEQQTISRASVGLRSERGPILLSVVLSVGLIPIDATILATAVPSIVNDLGGFTQFPWLFSIFLLAQAVSIPLFANFTVLW